MKATDLRPKTNDELKAELGSLRKEAFNLRFQKAGGQLGKTGRVRQVRRDIARIKTVLGEKARNPLSARVRCTAAFRAGPVPA